MVNTIKRLVSTTNGWKEILKDVKGWIVALIAVGVVFSYVQSMESPVKVIGEYSNANVAYIGEHYKICKTVEYTRDSALTIDRAFIENKRSGDIVTLNLPSFTIKREVGVYDICRIIHIPPEITEGDWIIKTYLSYAFGPWRHTREAPQIPVKMVFRKDK